MHTQTVNWAERMSHLCGVEGQALEGPVGSLGQAHIHCVAQLPQGDRIPVRHHHLEAPLIFNTVYACSHNVQKPNCLKAAGSSNQYHHLEAALIRVDTVVQAVMISSHNLQKFLHCPGRKTQGLSWTPSCSVLTP